MPRIARRYTIQCSLPNTHKVHIELDGGREAGRKGGRQAGRQAGREGGRQEGRDSPEAEKERGRMDGGREQEEGWRNRLCEGGSERKLRMGEG